MVPKAGPQLGRVVSQQLSGSSHGSSSPVTPMMELKPNAGSDRAWVWNTHADFADECPKPELLAIRFLNAESKQKGGRALGTALPGELRVPVRSLWEGLVLLCCVVLPRGQECEHCSQPVYPQGFIWALT